MYFLLLYYTANVFVTRLVIVFIVIDYFCELNKSLMPCPVAVAEWVAHLCADREITRSNPASYLCWAQHVGNVTGRHAGCQEVSMCRTRGESEE